MANSLKRYEEPEGNKSNHLAGGIRQQVFGIDLHEVTVKARGFKVVDIAQISRIEIIGRSFVSGYHSALRTGGNIPALGHDLRKVPRELIGFAYEGAAMGLTLLDLITPWVSRRFNDFVDGLAQDHIYMAYVGAGWAMARVPGAGVFNLRNSDPLLKWLSFDGYGFHDGYFYPERSIEQQKRPLVMRGYKAQAYDQGLGRGIWFVKGGDVVEIANTVASFDKSRQSDLWSGIGLAASYAGITTGSRLSKLRDLSGEHKFALAQGSAFAAKTRLRAGNCPIHTSLACEIFCDSDVATAATVTDVMLKDLRDTAEMPAYEDWRKKIQAYYAKDAS